MLWHWSTFLFLLYPYNVCSTEQNLDVDEKQPLILVNGGWQRQSASVRSSLLHDTARCSHFNAKGLEDWRSSDVRERLFDALYDFSDYERGVLEHIERIQWLYTQFTPDDEKEVMSPPNFMSWRYKSDNTSDTRACDWLFCFLCESESTHSPQCRDLSGYCDLWSGDIWH